MPVPTNRTRSSVPSEALKALAFTMPRSVDELDWYLRAHLGVKLARRAACPEHDAPLTFLAEAFFYDFPDILEAEGLREVPNAAVLGSRKSGKTYTLSLLHLLNSIFKPGCQTGHVAPSAVQGQHAYNYLRSFSLRPPYDQAIDRSIASETAFGNGSLVSVFTGSVKSVSGPTKQKLSVDEFDQWEWESLQTALQMLTPREGIRTQTWLASTRYTGDGLWTQMLDTGNAEHSRAVNPQDSRTADSAAFTIYQWCEWDTAAPCPVCNPECPLLYWHNPITEKDEGLCAGRLLNADGWRPVRDIIETYQRSDPVTWAIQRRCDIPGAGATLLDSFDPATHVRSLSTIATDTRHGRVSNHEAWPATAGVDWGYADPAVILVGLWAPDGTLWLVDCYYRRRAAPSAHLAAAKALADRWNIRRFTADPSQPGTIQEWRSAGLPIAPAERRQIADGLAAVRLRLRDNSGKATLFVDPRCADLIREIRSYKARTGDTPATGQDNHALDALRYLETAGAPSAGISHVVDLTPDDYRHAEIPEISAARPRPPMTLTERFSESARTREGRLRCPHGQPRILWAREPSHPVRRRRAPSARPLLLGVPPGRCRPHERRPPLPRCRREDVAPLPHQPPRPAHRHNPRRPYRLPDRRSRRP